LLDLAYGASSEGSFIVMRGYEYTREPGHLNVFNTASYNAPLSLDELYSWLAGQPEGVFAQFNHPAPADLGGMGDFDGFRFFPPAAHRLPLIENAWAQQFYLFHPQALSQGWELSSVGYGDSHDASQAGSRHYGVWASAMTRANLLDALINGRTFGNTDGYLVAALRGNGRWMGQALSADQIVLQLYAADASGDTITTVELIGQHGVIETWQPGTQVVSETVTIEAVQPGDFYYLHVTDARGGHAWSGSIIRPIRRTLQLTPATMQFTFADAADAPQVRTVRLDANDGTDAPWQVATHEPWIRVSPEQGDHLPATVTISVSPEALSLGAQSGGLLFQSQPLAPAAAGLAAHLGASSALSLEVTPRQLDLTTTLDAPAFVNAVQIAYTGENLAWYATANEPWLRLTASHGVRPGVLNFTADMQGYPAGLYTGHVIVTVGQQIRVTEVRVALQPRDPHTIYIQRGVSGGAAWDDTFLNMWEPNQPHGTQDRLVMRNASTDGASVPLLWVDLSEVPRQAPVFTATLSIHAYYKTVAGSSIYVQAYEVLRPWEANTATWTVPDASWSGPGLGARCVNLACQPGGVAIVNAVGRWYDLDVTEAVRHWVSDPSTNRGLALVGESNTNGLFMFQSSDAGSASAHLRPRLSLVYGDGQTTPTATPSAAPTATPSPTVIPEAKKAWMPLISRP
jgi:hypothetical protein